MVQLLNLNSLDGTMKLLKMCQISSAPFDIKTAHRMSIIIELLLAPSLLSAL